MTNIKLVEDKFNNGLLYRQNSKGSNEETLYYPNVPNTEPGAGKKGDSNSNITANDLINQFKYKPLNEEIFNNPLHGIKKMQDGKNLHLIIYPMPQDNLNEYNLESIKTNSEDYFIVLFPCLKTNKISKPKMFGLFQTQHEEERDNNLKIRDKISEIKNLGLKKEKTDFNYKNLEDYNYNYGVYTKNLKSNFDLNIIPYNSPFEELAPPSPPSPSTPSGTSNLSTPYTPSTPPSPSIPSIPSESPKPSTPLKTLKTLKVIKNTGQTNPPDDVMSNQCFWISIRDWHILKNKETNKTVLEQRETRKTHGSQINQKIYV